MAVATPLRAVVRCLPMDSTITISLLLRGSTHRLQREKDEKLEKTLTRISLTVAKFQKKERKRADKKFKNSSEIYPAEVRLLDEEEKEEVPLDTPNTAAWREGAWLHVDGCRYLVSINPPSVQRLEVASSVMVGSPVIPQADFESSDSSRCLWTWWGVTDPLPAFLDTELLVKSVLDPSLLPSNPPDALKIHSGMIYYPTQADVRKYLLIQCIPTDTEGRHGHPAYICSSVVSEGPNRDAIIRRQLQTPFRLLSADTLRVISYNILADCYSTSDFAYQVLYPYCQHKALQPDYRVELIVQEVVGYHPDIVCMQEVSAKWWDRYLLPAFREKGYDGHMAVKTGKVPEGEALLFNSSKYESLQTVKISLTQFLQEDKRCKDFFEELKKAPTVLNTVLKKHTIIQVTLLKSRAHQDRFILVGNTHLCYHPTEDHIRLVQSIICIRAIEGALHDFKTASSIKNGPKVAIIFCGDFNSCPCTGGYEFITKGRIEKYHHDWTQYKYALIPRCGCCEVPADNSAAYIMNYDPDTIQDLLDQERLEELKSAGVPCLFQIVNDDFSGCRVSHQFSLQDSCGPLPYTNYTSGFKAVLDYVFSSKDLLEVERVISLPCHEDVTQHTALPSVCFPSDHLALVCDLKWRI